MAEVNINLHRVTYLVCQETALDLAEIGRFFHRMDSYFQYESRRSRSQNFLNVEMLDIRL